MRPLLITTLLLGLVASHVHADEATKLKLQDPRYAEPKPRSTLKLAAEARPAPLLPTYPIPQEEKPAPTSPAPYWLAVAGGAVIGFGGLYLRRRRKGATGE